ncbi:transglutaminase-like enzyme [Proteus hauseri ATCC 700826]|uniref:Transglutaminase-like enzyme n=1 Tax=Proteus hauseri ATCC 700826 TaxID=1354271 RepID=A0AAJ3HRM3_PROHU|nr:DUF2569 domain-containing protein [Proteus hauseri]OAT45718.1 transglutaminase-like enzyme [Proteus hauseri ATCC 700826]
MHKWVCIKCGEKEISQYTEYCDKCSEKLTEKIGGWLYLPAIGLIFMLITSLISIVEAISETLPLLSLVTASWKLYLGFAFILDLFIFTLIIVTAISFFKKLTRTPKLYIFLLIANIATKGIAGLILMYGMQAPVDSEYTIDLIRSIFHAVIWVSYFRVSVRVKKTFVN